MCASRLLQHAIEQLIRVHDDDIRSGFIENSPGSLWNIHRHYAALAGQGEFLIVRCNAPWVSAVVEPDAIINCMKNGAQDYINKPFRFEQIFQSVNRTLDKRRVAMEIRRYIEEAGKKTSNAPSEPRKHFLGTVETLVSALDGCVFLRDPITAELAKGDPGVLSDLQALFVKTRQATAIPSGAPHTE